MQALKQKPSIHSLQHIDATMQWLIRINISCLALLFIVLVLPLESESSGRIFQSGIQLLFVFFLPGINLAALLQYLIKKQLSLRELLPLAAAFSFFFIPLLLTVEFTVFGPVSPQYPLANAVIILALAISSSLHSKFRRQNRSGSSREIPLNFQILKTFVLSREILLPFFIYSLATLGIVTAFYPLPDLDPYYWYGEFQKSFPSGILVPIDGHRPLFSSLSYIFTVGSSVDFYAFFKYVLPFLFLSVLLPVSLFASTFSRPLHRAILLLFPFVNGIGITYITLPIPQALAGIACLFSVFLSLYAWKSKDSVFFAAGGAALCIGYWYHEALALPIAIWIFTSIFFFRRHIFLFVRKNILSTALLFLFIAPHLSIPLKFIASSISEKLPQIMEFRTNLLFPEHYVNVDGNEMGWGNLIGVGKYYLFYAGPVLFILYFLIVAGFRKARWNMLIAAPTLPLILSLFAFFLIAEVLPRLFSIALLPDRAWVFIGIFSAALIPMAFETPLGRRPLLLWAFILAFSLNIGAALYINTLKKHLITEYQLTSASWIKTHLPENRRIFTFDHGRLLRFYSDSEVISVPDPNFYYNLAAFEREFENHTQSKERLGAAYQQESNRLQNLLSEFALRDPDKNPAETIELLGKIDDSLKASRSLLVGMHVSPPQESIYVYYAAPDPENPYLNRPYMKKTVGKEKDIIFDKEPNRFKRLYSDEEHRIYLWEIL